MLGCETMGVIKTNRWIELYLAHSNKKTLEERYRQLFIQPLQSLFSYSSDNELASFLSDAGMFKPGQLHELEKMLQYRHLEIARDHFDFLREKWDGPNIPIYILLADKSLKKPERAVGGKMGISFSDGIVLFIPFNLSELELKALLTHEYHHVCRLKVTNESEQSITLLESMIMEGLAEIAVEEEVGETYTAPWTKLYDKAWRQEWFTEYIEKRLLQKGRLAYKDILYGRVDQGIPRMLGYYAGYRLCTKVATDLKKKTAELMITPSRTFLEYAKRYDVFKNLNQ